MEINFSLDVFPTLILYCGNITLLIYRVIIIIINIMTSLVV
jgi:hypothetical protein